MTTTVVKKVFLPLQGKACKNHRVITVNGCNNPVCDCEWFNFPVEHTEVIGFLKEQNDLLRQENRRLHDEIRKHKQVISNMEDTIIELEYKIPA